MRKLLVILLDASEAALIEKWTDDGSLPNLGRLRAAGTYAHTRPEVLWMAGLPWFPFYTGRRYEYFPLPFYLVWDPEKMTLQRPSPGRLSLPVFWRALQEGGPRAVVIDMPWVPQPEPFNGVEIAGWATHDTIFEEVQTYPPEYRAWIYKVFGKQIRYDENSAPMNAREFLRVRDKLCQITDRVAELSETLLRREAWDLFMVNFSTPHIAGHKLWDLTNVVGGYTEAQKAEMLDAMRQVYIACDRAVGRLLSVAGEDVNVIALAIHGMQDNITRNAILPEMLRRVLADEYLEGLPLRKKGWLPALRSLVPADWRHAVKSRLPFWIQDQLTVFWRAGQGRWKDKKAVSLPADVQGMIRINLKGREAEGVVEPGPEYETLCAEIMEGLRSFLDADTGEPFIQNITRLNADEKGQSTLKLDCYPDLTIDWVQTPARTHRALFSPKYGTIPWPTPLRNPEGRSGNHHMEGFIIAAGADIKSGTIKDARMIDLAPTILALLGQPVPDEMDGRSLDIIG